MPAINVTVKATFSIAFGVPDFIMPAGLTTIEESAFEGITGMSAVDAGNCTSIGRDAFLGCTGLTRIRLAGDCVIDPDAFEGNQQIYIFAPAGGSTETFCKGYDNLIFVEEPLLEEPLLEEPVQEEPLPE